MLFTNVKSYNFFSVGDKVRIKGKYIPPCSGVHPIHRNFLQYMKEEDNLFTITNLKVVDVNDDFVIITVFEVSELLEYKQIMPIIYARNTILVNWSDRWQQKLLNLKITAK